MTTFPVLAFTPLGPLKTAANNAPDPWQGSGYDGRPAGLGYDLAGDIGGPMFPIEAYRWNVPTLTYAFDESFLRFFGTNGVNAVEQAIRILNDLPRASQMSADLAEFALDTKSFNHGASLLGLLDVKSHALALLVEEMGLANPERFVFGLRGRQTGMGFTNYSVIQINYDPITLLPSRYVNGQLYNYFIDDAIGPMGGEWASAIEWYQLDPFVVPYSSVAGGLGSPDAQLGQSPSSFIVSGLGFGEFFRGLTRDDAGGLRFLLNTNNLAVEGVITGVSGNTLTSGRRSPWSPVVIGATNVTGTNVFGGTNVTNFIVTAVRQGVDKVRFQRVNFDSLLGQVFVPITNTYTELVITNGRAVRQRMQRVITEPDIVFLVQDLGTVFEIPVHLRRTDTGNWQNNDLINGRSNLSGPGIIAPPIQIAFSDQLPYFLNLEPFTGDSEAFGPVVWGSFDETATPPVIYPQFLNITTDYLLSFEFDSN